MSVDGCHIQTQLNFLEIMLSLSDEGPKRSGDFETTYKTESGKEIKVVRSPDGKFANKNSSASSSENPAAAVSVGKIVEKAVGGFANEVAKMPAKVQDAVRKAIFESELSREIDKGVEKFIELMSEPPPGMKFLNKAYGSGLKVGFKLGQSIKDELAKKPFAKFAETVTAKFEGFRKDLPQKSLDLRKEIIRIAKDPNTSTIVTAGLLLGLGAYFHITGIQKFLVIAKNVAKLSNPDILTAMQNYKSIIPFIEQVKDGLIGAGSGMFRNIVGAILVSEAGRVIMNRVKSNEVSEKAQLKTKIAAIPDDSDNLYQEAIDLDKNEQEVKRKIVASLQKESPQEGSIDAVMSLILPTLSIGIGKKNEDYLANNPTESDRILQEIYEEANIRSLFAKLDIAMTTELQAMFAGKSDLRSESQITAIKTAIEDAVAKLVKIKIVQANLE